MVSMSDLTREARFLAKQRYVNAFLAAVFALTLFSVWSGVAETREQQSTIERLLDMDAEDRASMIAAQSDYGDAAYYTFHLTYSEPDPLAFSAMGQRDVYPWKHRIRMLALEGQIYETDAENPELSFLGKFDFAFLISVLLPLFVILLLHDIRSGEREAGRYDLLVATAGNQHKLWTTRALVLSCALALTLLLPLFVGALVMKASLIKTLLIALVTLGHLAFWSAITLFIGHRLVKRGQNSARIASALLAVWLVLTVIVPVVADTVINQVVESPNGGDIVLLQREEVNGAWDKPFSDTWDAFLSTHPEWADYTEMETSFHWKWYFAFQQVGDQKAASLSESYRQAIIQKDEAAYMVSLISPPMLVQRILTSLANTDITASLEYEQEVRDFHQSLRTFNYPLLFQSGEFDHEMLADLPTFTPRTVK